jgi:hypothetical protein
MQGASPGALIRVVSRRPPWIVVNKSPSTVIPTKWPGTLWRVQITDAATAADQSSRGGAPRESAGYVRAVAVKIICKEDVAGLFGPHGAQVVSVIDAASKLDRRQAHLLSSGRDPRAAQVQDRAWRAWMRTQQIPDDRYPGPLDGTLLLGTSGSPINRGLSVLYDVMFRRAKELEGDGAVVEDGEDVWLAPPWRSAFDALTDAALGLGAPDLINSEDQALLLRSWVRMQSGDWGQPPTP